MPVTVEDREGLALDGGRGDERSHAFADLALRPRNAGLESGSARSTGRQRVCVCAHWPDSG